jgi:rubredoxin
MPHGTVKISRICGYLYDDAKVLPFNDLTETWTCPIFSAAKQHFVSIITLIFDEDAKYIEIHVNYEIHTQKKPEKASLNPQKH